MPQHLPTSSGVFVQCALVVFFFYISKISNSLYYICGCSPPKFIGEIIVTQHLMRVGEQLENKTGLCKFCYTISSALPRLVWFIAATCKIHEENDRVEALTSLGTVSQPI